MTTTSEAGESTWQPAYPNGNGNGNGRAGEEEGPRAQPRARVHARGDAGNAEPAADPAPVRAPLGTRVWHALVTPVSRGVADAALERAAQYTAQEAAAPEVGRQSFWREGPASLADLAQYTRSGAWAPGDNGRGTEIAGKAYGYLIAIPVTAVLYSVAFILQRPTRLAIVAVVLFLAWAAGAIGGAA